MKWKRKALIQKAVAGLPSNLSYAVHYFLQRRLGGLKSVDPTQEHLLGAMTIADHITRHGGSIEGKTFLELGPGRRVNLPIALWLGGAAKIITVDRNPYLKSEIVFENIVYLQQHRERVAAIMGRYAESSVFQDRFDQLLQAPDNLNELLKMMHIDYVAPTDAAHLNLPDGSIDYYLSYNVVEFIPAETLRDILAEGKRVLNGNGLHVHSIDFADWFSISDLSITSINFLQFSESEWNYYAGNRYMYHNRMRVDDYVAMFNSIGLDILSLESKLDNRALEELKRGFRVDERFRNKSNETNATSSAWIVASRARG